MSFSFAGITVILTVQALSGTGELGLVATYAVYFAVGSLLAIAFRFEGRPVWEVE
jgi:hypothetical protein